MRQASACEQVSSCMTVAFVRSLSSASCAILHRTASCGRFASNHAIACGW